ncbi:MAG: sigma-70 family RNA polymerase sigma factor [Blastocatellia bacterium]|nr:sigma-70 family RNA polymerase sigma factor [Blastocatellia bacterium]
MEAPEPRSVTQLLVAWNSGDEQAQAELITTIYDELRRLASHYLSRERPNHTLQPTALVNEAFMRLVDGPQVNWQGRSHFFGIAANLMRQILVDHARKRQALKRGSGEAPLVLDEMFGVFQQRAIDLVRLDDALTELTRLDPQQARIVELRFFAGLTIEETAETLGISPATVGREWTSARLWLRRELSHL